MRRPALAAAAAWMALARLAHAQEPAPPPDAAETAPEPPRKPRPKPRPTPQAKPQAKPSAAPAEAREAGQGGGQDMPMRGSLQEAAEPPPAPSPAPSALAATPFAAPPVACEPGQAVQYEGADKAPDLWVTRSGTITIDNPLRPLTPDVTRVLQVVIGGRVATAYGPDLLSLRRGASPAVLEGTIGGAIRWDGSLAGLPDALPIHADTGEPLADFRFRACGPAPAARTLPAPKARRTAPTEAEMAATAAKEAKEAAKSEAGKPGRPARRAEPRPEGAPPKPAVPLPQGAIP